MGRFRYNSNILTILTLSWHMTRARKQSNSSLGSIRIIGGVHRGRKLPVLNAQGLRPTTDRMKETLFNWLMMDVHDATCLDCFAGAGSLGFEALSRGAKSAIFMEMDKSAAKQLQSNANILKFDSKQVIIQQGNSLNLLKELNDSFDIIYIDPPFNQDLVSPCVETIVQEQLAHCGTKIYIEREANGSLLQVPESWRVIKEKSTQQVIAQLFIIN
ncbi:MAG: 16S rRNA (guanine966-N2)-methyltransferase [Arenicella sp.]|jgi:16S rRNA (guanine966-N2)-methyltransferase